MKVQGLLKGHWHIQHWHTGTPGHFVKKYLELEWLSIMIISLNENDKQIAQTIIKQGKNLSIRM